MVARFHDYRDLRSFGFDQFRCSTGTTGRHRRRARKPSAQSIDFTAEKSGRPGSNRRRPAWESDDEEPKTLIRRA